MRIRDELGLAYYVGAQNLVGVSPGYFAFYAGTSSEHVDQVERELLAGALSLATEGLTADELRRAKAKVVGQRKIARQDLSHLAMTTALDELYGLGYRYGEGEDARYESVSLEQARAVAQEQFLPDRRVIAIAQADER